MLKLQVEFAADGVTVARCAGRLVWGEPELHRLPLLLDHSSRPLALDLGRVELIDAAGVGVLAELVQRAREAGVELLLWNPNPRVREVLEVTGLGGLCESAPGDPGDDTLRPRVA